MIQKEAVYLLRKQEHELPYKGAVEGYVVNFLTRNYWRVQGSMDRDDVMQESYWVYLRVARKYPDVESKHLMALFKTAWGNHFTDLALGNTEKMKEETILDDPSSTTEVVGEVENTGFLSILVQQAPSEVKQVLSLFLHAPTEVYALFFDVNQREYNRYKNRNRTINRLLGFEKNRDIMGEVKAYFS